METVGGLLAHELGRVSPSAGSEATVSGLHLTAENLAGHRRNKLGTVLIERVPRAETTKRLKAESQDHTSAEVRTVPCSARQAIP